MSDHLDTDNGATNEGVSYAAAGVDIEAGDRAVELFAPLAKRATRPEVRGNLGGFAGLFELGKYKKPVLAAGSDGVGTKLVVAQMMDKHDTIGIDCVAMNVNDAICIGWMSITFPGGDEYGSPIGEWAEFCDANHGTGGAW